MLNWLTKQNHSEYKERILKAFPKYLETDVKAVLSVLPFGENKVKLCDGQIHQVDNLIHPSTLTVNLENEVLVIPYRLYFNEPNWNKKKSLLTDKEQF